MHRARGVRLLSNAALFTLGVLFACAVGEVGLRLLGLPSSAEPRDGEPAILRQEERTGWMTREGAHIEVTPLEGESFVLRVNSTGQRGDEVGPRSDPAQRRILFLGDSFTMAVGVRDGDTFVQRVSELLNDRGSRRFQAINGGVAGYGTYQELAYYRYYGRPLEPDVVVLGVFLGNDFRDNMITTRQGELINPILVPNWRDYARRHEEPFLRDSGDDLLVDPISAEPVRVPSLVWVESLVRRSLLARLVRSRWDRLVGRWTASVFLLDMRSRYYFYEIGLYQRLGDELLRTARELTADCIRQLHRLVIDDGAELVLVLLPSQSQVDRQHWKRTLETLDLPEDALGPLDMRYPNRILAALCEKEGILLCDLTDQFAGAEDSGSLYLTSAGDRHFSIAGHRLAAEGIAACLAEGSRLLNNPAVELFREGERYAASGDLARAEKAFLAGIHYDADWAPLHVALGGLYLRARAWERAETAFRRGAELDARLAGAWEGLASSFRERGAVREAVQSYRRALQARPGWWPYWEALRDLYAQRNMESEAREAERQMAALFDTVPKSRQYWWLEHISRGIHLQARGELAPAAREFTRAGGILPDRPASFRHLGQVRAAMGEAEKAKSARSLYRRSITRATGEALERLLQEK